MRDLVFILLVALAGMGMALWALRRWPTQPRAEEQAPDTASRAPAPYRAETEQPDIPEPPPIRRDASGNAVFGTLEFDMAPWNVSLTQPEVVIGRHSEDDVRIPDVRVSRHHAKLVARRNGSFEIHNLTAVRSEPNPMLINGTEREHADIFDGDVVTLGGISFTFRRAA